MLTAVPRLFFFFSLLFFFFTGIAIAQEQDIETVPNQPSPEVYDILKDRKGYLWIAHDQGVSRYDGAVFTTLRHPQQSSIALTSLMEDKKGRIWCYNFSGQIFYIENFQLHLLTDYKHKDELVFPRITICGDELVASSSKGVFVHHLVTGKSTYHFIPNGTVSLTRLKNKVILRGPNGWYRYEGGRIVKLAIDKPIPKTNVKSVQVQNVSFRDTFYVIANPAGIYYKMTLENDTIRVHSAKKTGVFINTISVEEGKAWVHTKQHSFTTDGKSFIANMNLADILTDKQGNRWMSSLKRGLCVQYNLPYSKRVADSLFEAGDDILTMFTAPNAVFWGTSTGQLYQMQPGFSLRRVASIPKEAGGIEKIAAFGETHLLLGASTGLFSYNLVTGAIRELPLDIAVKDAVLHKEKLYLAQVAGISTLTKEELQHSQTANKIAPSIMIKKARCRSLAFVHDSLIAGYSDGVFVVHKGHMQPLLYKGKEIYASAIRTVGTRVVIGTFTQGLFILEGKKLKNLTEENNLASNFVKNVKVINGTVWLLFADCIQQLKADLSGAADYPVPITKGGITDFSMLGKHLFFSTSNGVYSLDMSKEAPLSLSTTFIDKIIANNTEVITGNQLKPFQNYLQFHVSTPFFSSNSKIIYEYRIKNATDSAWQRSSPGENMFDLIVLEPGVYTLEIVATDENRKILSRPASYQFELLPAWYQHWITKSLAALAAIAIVLYIVWLYYRNRLRQQQLAYEKQLAIQAERHRISTEIHDDIGAGLSAVRLLTEMTKSKLPESEVRDEVEKIHMSVSELSYKMREVIWSLNTDNDRLENLLNYIRRQAFLLFENSPIRLKVIFPVDEIPALVIKSEKRRHIYLSVKEALHNCLKHSGAQNCTLTMRIDGPMLNITVADDGKGFAPPETCGTGNGLTGMKRRMQAVNGFFEVEAKESTRLQFVIPLTENI